MKIRQDVIDRLKAQNESGARAISFEFQNARGKIANRSADWVQAEIIWSDGQVFLLTRDEIKAIGDYKLNVGKPKGQFDN